MVRLVDEHGAAGFGEAAPIPWFGTETADEVAAACARLGTQVGPGQIEAIPERLGCLRFALTSALSECRAKGQKDEVKEEPGGHAAIAALLPAGREAPGLAARKAEAGFRTFKWKVGAGDALDELALLDDLLAALPPGARLRLDANGAWDRRTAERWLGRCADLPMVEFVEQPVAAAIPDRETDARARMKTTDLLLGLAGDFPVPLALDESAANAHDVNFWLEAEWPGLFVLKPALLGDVAGVLARLQAAGCDAQSGRVVFSSALETAVGARAALGWALRWEEEIPSERSEKPDNSKSQISKDGVVDGGKKLAKRAAGFGVWPLFEDARFDGPAAAPFVRAKDIRIPDEEAAWNALS